MNVHNAQVIAFHEVHPNKGVGGGAVIKVWNNESII